MAQPIYEFGGSGTVMHIALANGFPPESYKPLLQPFTARYRVVCLPPRPLWPEAHDPKKFGSWRDMGADLLAGLRHYELTDIVGVGHSMGGVATMLAAIAEPQRFRALVLLDPVFMSPSRSRGIRLMQWLGQAKRIPLAKGALNRRRQWRDIDEAFDYFRGKRLFADWADETLRLYTAGITKPSANGAGIELAWSPEWEAQYYMNIFSDSWREVPKLRNLLPVLIIRGGSSDTLAADVSARLARVGSNITIAELPGHGHLFPQSAPDATRRIIEDWLATLG